MRCLITGGAGFIGSFLAEELLERGNEVILYDNLCPQVHPNGSPSYLTKKAQLIIADIRNSDALLKTLKKTDAVIHLASAVGVAQSQYEIQHYCDVNVQGTATLCEIIIKNKLDIKKILVAGSMTSYGEGVYLRKSDGAYIRPQTREKSDVYKYKSPFFDFTDNKTGELLTPVVTPESARLNGTNIYALTKRMQEDLILNLDSTYDIPSIAFRFFNVYGPRQSLSNPYTGVLAIFISQILNKKHPLIFEDGLQTRDFVYVKDVATAIADALESPIRKQVLNIGSGKGSSILDLANKLCAILDFKEQPDITGRFRKGDIRHCNADIKLAEDLIAYKPKYSIKDGIKELLEWSCKQNPTENSAKSTAELYKYGLTS